MAKPDLILQHLQKVDVKLDQLSNQMGSPNVSFTTLESRLAAMEARMAGIELRLARIEQRLGLMPLELP
jgi:hypothetical protein